MDWDKQEDDDLVRSVSIETSDYWDRLAQEQGLYLPFICMDHASRDQNTLASYGPDSLAKLRAISEKYDASQTFQQKLQNGGFLLSLA